MVLAHDHVELPSPDAEELSDAALGVAVRVALLVLLREPEASDPLATELDVQRLRVGKGDTAAAGSGR